MTKEEKQNSMLEKVIQDYLWATDYRRQFEPDWERAYRLYKSYIDKQTYPFESKLFIPYIFAIIEVQLPIIMQTLFGNGQFLEVEGRNISSQEMASMVKEVISYQFERDINAFSLTARWAKQVLIYGTSPAFADWKYVKKKMNVRVPEKDEKNGLIKYVSKKLSRIIANQPMADVIDIFRYFQCPITVGSPASSDVLFAGWEFQKTYEELMADVGNGLYKKDAVESLKGRTQNNTELLANRLNILNKIDPNKVASNQTRGLIDCINYFGSIPNDDGEMEYKLLTIAFPDGFPRGDGVGGPNGIIIGEKEDPLNIDNIPIVLCRTNLMEGELYGVGDVQAVESLQIELNDQRNQRCDNVVRSMNQMWKVKKGNDIDEAMMQFRPHGLIECEDPASDILPLNPNMMQLNQSLVEESVIKQDIQFATGVTDFIAGTSQNTTGFNDTATGISLIQAAAQGRLTLKAQFLQVAIKELAELVWKLDQQFLPFDSVMKVLDPFSASKFRFIRATPDMINGQYDFSIVNAPSSGNPQVRRQQLIQIIDGVSKLIAPAQAAGQPINISYPHLILRLLREFNIPNIGEILPDVATMAEVNNLPSFVDTALDDGQSIDADTENLMMAEGESLEVHPGDPDLEHIVSHERLKRDSDDIELGRRVDLHNTKHMAQMEKKKELSLQMTQANADATQNGQLPGNSLVNELMNMASQVQGNAEGESGNSPNGALGNEEITRDQGNANQIRAV